MGITFGDYLIDSGYYDPEEEPMPVEDMRTQAEFDERMERAEKRGEICEALRIAQGQARAIATLRQTTQPITWPTADG